MKKLIKMPSIGQFNNTVRDIQHTTRFTGVDENGNPVYNGTKRLPTLKAVGTVKLHGTNASICFNNADNMWFQSKENIITPEKDNAGFAFFGETNKYNLTLMIWKIAHDHRISLDTHTITVYGEWAGKGIQKGVGISQIDRSFFVFGVKVSPKNNDDAATWLTDYNIDNYIPNVFDIRNFKTFEIDINFNEPMLSYNAMVDMVKSVEDECPVAKAFGVDGIGEGIVFSVNLNGVINRWKIKGDKHAGKSKVKVFKKVDDVKLQAIIDLVDKVTPEWRLEQMYQETFDTLNGGKPDIKMMGDFIRKVVNDIIKEETLTLSDAGFIPKDINPRVSKVAREWLVNKINEEIMS